MLGVNPACDGEEATRMSEVHRAVSGIRCVLKRGRNTTEHLSKIN